MRRLWLLLPLALAVTACGGSTKKAETSGSSGGTPLQTLTVSEKEFSITPNSFTVPKPGLYEFDISNDGKVGHALAVEGHGVEAKTATIDPGSSGTLQVNLAKSGSYEVYCPIDGHKDKGMKATLTVGGTAAPGVGGTQSTPSTTGQMTTTNQTTTSQPGY